MKVLNLLCSQKHSFEGWFGSEDDFQSQLARGLIECPLCADKHINKLPSAPRLNLGGFSESTPDVGRKISESSPGAALAPSDSAKEATTVPTTEAAAQAASALAKNVMVNVSPSDQAAFLQALRQVVSSTEDVGQRFADEARRMHYGETQARSIRGQASVREAVELLEEGIEVLPLPMLPALKETLQ